MKKEIIKKLKKVGVFLHKGSFSSNPITDAATMPVCAIWHESEDPTDKEIDFLAKLVQEKLDTFNPQLKKRFCAHGANMLTLKKENGQWTFRRMTWSQGPTWFPYPDSLEEIKESL